MTSPDASIAGRNRLRFTAIGMLLLATFLWGFSFVLIKSLGQVQAPLAAHRSSLHVSLTAICFRFGLGALLLLPFCGLNRSLIRRDELVQGLGLAAFGGAGLWFQMDALNYIGASTSAFLTQIYCFFIPVWVSLISRRWPSPRITLSCLMILMGSAILSGLKWNDFHPGRGELETVLASVLFTGQILWLERPVARNTRSLMVTEIMFALIALGAVIYLLSCSGGAQDIIAVYRSGPAWVLSGCLAVFCTAMAYALMNHWQKHVTATEAGLIYGVEPVFASIFALFAPGLISPLAGIQYANEPVTATLLLGGGLIVLANVVMQTGQPAVTTTSSAP